MANKWYFPHGEKLTPRGVNDPAINSFLDNVIDSLTREVIQNSLDAKDRDIDAPVEIAFDFKDIATSSIPGINQLREEALPLAQEFWTKKDNKGTLDYLEKFRQNLDSDTIKILKISDYNTYGLNDRSYDALVLGNGYTEKVDGNAAGSKGIGKAAPFAISDLRLVFYNTKPKNQNPKHVGVLNFVSYKIEESDKEFITQERALYQTANIDFIEGQIDFGFPKRSLRQNGTDIFIIGLRKIDDDWKNRILLSAVNNFLVSILERKLIVKIDGSTLNDDNIAQILESLSKFPKTLEERKVFESTQNYYDALTTESRLEFNLDERFLKYSFVHSLKDGKLYLLKRENANRSILQTRISGMKIYDRKSISGNINFTGVFRAIGTDLDKFLKNLENTNHTGWSPDQAPEEDRENAKKLLKDLFDWFKHTVKESFELSAEDIIDAFGMSDFLPLLSNEQGKLQESTETGITNKINEIEIKRGGNKRALNQSSSKQEENLEMIIEELGFGDDGSPEGYKNKKKKANKKSLIDRLKLGTLLKKEKLVAVDDELRLKSVVMDSSLGEYKFIIRSKKAMKAIELRLNYVGEDGAMSEASVLSAISRTHKVKVTDSVIRIDKIEKNQLVTVDLKIDSNVLVKMEGSLYEVKV